MRFNERPMWGWHMRRSERCSGSHGPLEVIQMKAHYLGHVVHYVKDLEQSLAGCG
jgi:hypothetical protein